MEQLSNQSPVPIIRHAPMDEIILYQIYEGELDTIEEGSADSVILNLAIFLLGVGFSFLSNALLLDRPNSIVRFNIFVGILICSLIIGSIMLVVWWKLPNRRDKIIEKIRKRYKPPEGTQTSA